MIVIAGLVWLVLIILSCQACLTCGSVRRGRIDPVCMTECMGGIGECALVVDRVCHVKHTDDETRFRPINPHAHFVG